MMTKFVRKALIGFQILLISTPAMMALSYILNIPMSAFLLPAGITTIIFHAYMGLVTHKRPPLFLGPSFLIALIVYTVKKGDPHGFSYVTGGIIVASAVYFAIALLIKTIGLYKFINLFPPVVVGSMVLSVGIGLASIQSAFVKHISSDIVAVTLGSILLLYAFVKPAKKFSLLLGFLVGVIYYSLKVGFNFTFIQPGSFSSLRFAVPQFDLKYSILFALAAIATILEHIGDIFAISMVTDKPYYISPGLHNTIAANGASALTGILMHPSGPITYTETIGLYAMMKDFDPDYALYAAFWAIIAGLIEIITGVKVEFPLPVVASLMFLASGMIGSIGIRIFVENEVNIANSRNFIIMSIMLSVAVFDVAVPTFKGVYIKGVVVSGLIGIILNLILPGREGDENRG